MSARKAVPPAEPSAPRVEKRGNVWRIRALEPARQVLRARHQTTQAGFTAERIPRAGLRHRPILINDGPVHDEQRSDVARFFAPRTVEGYEPLMIRCAERRLAGYGDVVFLDELALHYAVEVTAEIVGLLRDQPPDARERSVRGMSRRLVAFFRQPPFDIGRRDLGRTPRQWLAAAANGLGPLAGFYLRDVRPVLRERRRRPGRDVLSHLIARDYSEAELLIEATTYGTAGMVTTREFIVMAAWHLLDDVGLRARYLAGDREARHAILHEIIRLEPPVGHLYRRAQADVEVVDGDLRVTIPAGDAIDICVRQANADEGAVGSEPLMLRPGRALPAGVHASALSFGDGAHRCPGQALAVWEADILLTRLLAGDPALVSRPELGWDDMIAGYTLRGFRVRRG